MSDRNDLRRLRRWVRAMVVAIVLVLVLNVAARVAGQEAPPTPTVASPTPFVLPDGRVGALSEATFVRVGDRVVIASVVEGIDLAASGAS